MILPTEHAWLESYFFGKTPSLENFSNWNIYDGLFGLTLVELFINCPCFVISFESLICFFDKLINWLFFFKLENEKLIFSLIAINVIIYFNILKYLVECISLFVNLYLITLPKFFYKINKIIFSFNYVFPVFCGIFILVLYLFPEYFQFLKFSLYSVTHMKTAECTSNFL